MSFCVVGNLPQRIATQSFCVYSYRYDPNLYRCPLVLEEIYPKDIATQSISVFLYPVDFVLMWFCAGEDLPQRIATDMHTCIDFEVENL